uniref:DNA topoisomerase n=1 Tax=viral metagenome TaxID=1070528 RepID=A0A6C0H858_9ZZZZ
MKNKILVIVESPGKINKISSYLGPSYIVKASCGHIQDLDKKTLSIDIENNFTPLYIIPSDKIKLVNELKKLVKQCKDVILATDGDREGEFIAYSLAVILNLDNPKRIIFNEITKEVILKAIETPKPINYPMVYAQRTRRILDRLVGYKISPLLWSHYSDTNNEKIQSAGRVQSVILRIIKDKENEIINKPIQSYFKIEGIFSNIHSNLNYEIISEEEKDIFLDNFNNNIIIKIIDIQNNKICRQTYPPFITSTLQQEASKQLKFNIKKTMDIAQKLYESGLITYMRTDCYYINPNILETIKQYIINNYGNEYYKLYNYESHAHECIRPTNIEISNLNNYPDEYIKLYNLIWKRTIASQMSDIQINIKTIKIDIEKNSKSIFTKKNNYFITTKENMEFKGYLIVNNNTDINSSQNNNLLYDNLYINQQLIFNKLIIQEAFHNLPSRYNEPDLIKFLDEKGIGRPSTYVSIISKIIDKNYIEIKNIVGIKKVCNILELNSNFEIIKTTKEIYIGNEKEKMILTEIGDKINTFLINNFDSIINISFTAELEILLDKIVSENINYLNILFNYYSLLNPIVEKLTTHNKNNNDILIGDGIYKGIGKYGSYVKIYENNKWKYASIEDINNITLEKSIELLKYPKFIGTLDNMKITLNMGPHGLYIKYGDNKQESTISMKNISEDIITLDYIKKLILEKQNNIFKTFKHKTKTINIIKNDKGYYYIQIISNGKKINKTIPNIYSINTITLRDILEIIK